MEKSCFFTGHRVLPAEKIDRIREYLKENIRNYAHRGVVNFISGGARGFDLLAASTVIDLQRGLGDIRLKLYLPCHNYEENWPDKDMEMLHKIATAASEIQYVKKQAYTPDCLKLRNEKMVADARYGIAFCLYRRSGTGQTMALANQYGREVMNIADRIYDK